MAYFIVLNKTLFFFLVSQISFNKEGPKPVMLYKKLSSREDQMKPLYGFFFKMFSFGITVFPLIRLVFLIPSLPFPDVKILKESCLKQNYSKC